MVLFSNSFINLILDYLDPCDYSNGWNLLNGKCYCFYEEPTTWPEARKICQRDDGDLITVNSNQELGLISESASSYTRTPRSIWLGYSDVSKLSVFTRSCPLLFTLCIPRGYLIHIYGILFPIKGVEYVVPASIQQVLILASLSVCTDIKFLSRGR